MSQALVGCLVVEGRSRRTPRSSAHHRLLDAIVRAAGGEGYSDLTVERVLEVARVSRASFYQYFSSLEDCFADAYRRQAKQLINDIACFIRAGESPEFALLAALIGMGRCDPDGARLLAIEGLAAGPLGLRVRDELISSIERTMLVAGTDRLTADLPAALLIGTALRFLAMRLTDSGVNDISLTESWAWVSAFSNRASQLGWSARLAPTSPAGAPLSPRLAASVRPCGSARERILAAAARTVREKGYRNTAVADIVATAKVSRRSFYNEFANKSDVVIAACEHTFRRLLETCTPAFLSGRDWPERVWRCGLAFTGFFTSDPGLAHLGFVDCYAVGRAFVVRLHEMQLSFTLFLEEGYRQHGHGRDLPRLYAEMTAAALMEIGFHASRGQAEQPIRRLQPLAAYIVLTPFLGSDDAAGFVLGNL